MTRNLLQRLALCLISLSLLIACGSQASVSQTPHPVFLSETATSATNITSLPAMGTPCLGVAPAPTGTPEPWPYADVWDKVAIARMPIQGMECASSEEIVRKLVLQWFETIKTSASPQMCILEDYTLDTIQITGNIITPQYDIVARIVSHVKIKSERTPVPCEWSATRGLPNKDGWLESGDYFGVYREDGYFRLIVLPNWGIY